MTTLSQGDLHGRIQAIVFVSCLRQVESIDLPLDGTLAAFIRSHEAKISRMTAAISSTCCVDAAFLLDGVLQLVRGTSSDYYDDVVVSSLLSLYSATSMENLELIDVDFQDHSAIRTFTAYILEKLIKELTIAIIASAVETQSEDYLCRAALWRSIVSIVSELQSLTTIGEATIIGAMLQASQSLVEASKAEPTKRACLMFHASILKASE